jgi:hypothetical protein
MPLVLKGSLWATVKCCLCDHEAMVQVLETYSYRNVEKSYMHKNQSDRTLSQTRPAECYMYRAASFYTYISS